ncbi:YoaK family protein [Herminiimonas sp.]|uniref:YoaK family protein n=1 Tax=Herminiimonas sp. TaxID=1926289 RepID=UPI002722B5DC|nr:YoaK family protein [Herminiimonas sp.]MDO8306660.1 YoaK family protein [Herminiimonas sp.]
MKRSELRHKIQNSSLGFLAGYVDTLGFVALFGLFTAHVTGNFVLIGAEMAHPQGGPLLLKILAFPAFIFGVVIARLMIAALLKYHLHALWYAYILQLALLIAFMVAGIKASPIAAEPTLMAEIAGIIGAMAMGTHSACGRLLLSHLAPTAMMTGNVTQLVIDAVDVMRGAADDMVKQRCIKFLWPVVAFAIGAVGAAFAYQFAGFYALLLPIVILLYLMYIERGAMHKTQNMPKIVARQ